MTKFGQGLYDHQMAAETPWDSDLVETVKSWVKNG